MYDFLNTKEWLTQRKRILKRDNNSCQICGNSYKAMNVHHICYKEPLSEVRDIDLITLCPTCHHKVHKIQSRMYAFYDKVYGDLEKQFGEQLAKEINKEFPLGILGRLKSRALSTIRCTIQEQRKRKWILNPDFHVLQKKVKTKRK